jgi:hypothetical protein
MMSLCWDLPLYLSEIRVCGCIIRVLTYYLVEAGRRSGNISAWRCSWCHNQLCARCSVYCRAYVLSGRRHWKWIDVFDFTAVSGSTSGDTRCRRTSRRFVSYTREFTSIRDIAPSKKQCTYASIDFSI